MLVEDIKPEDAVPPTDNRARRMAGVCRHLIYLRRRLRALEKLKFPNGSLEGQKNAVERARIEGYIKEMNDASKISSGKGKFENPYLLGGTDSDRYIGSPENYKDFSLQMKKQYEELKSILAANGLHIDTLYASKHVYKGNRFNFAGIGAGGRFVWRKYDPAPGAGQNWVYIDGERLNTSTFLSMPVAKRQKLLEPLKNEA